MSDFLRNLRSTHKKDAPSSRKTLEGNYYPQSDRRIISDRRIPNDSDSTEILIHQLGNALPEVLENMTTLTEHVEKMAAINQLLAESKNRQQNAIADFFTALNKIISSDTRAGISDSPPKKATASYTSGTHYTKDDILSIIQNMREQGSTFSLIADYLKEKSIPTFSGRGEWHAQTIHRLCK